MSARFVILLVIAILALVLGFLFGGKQDRDAATEGSTAARATDGSSTAGGAVHTPAPAPGQVPAKTGERPEKKTLTVPETQQLAEATTLPSTSLPAQTLAERVAALNILLENHGGVGTRLRLKIDPRVEARRAEQGAKESPQLGALELRNTSALTAAMYVAGDAKMRFMFEEGWIVLTDEDLLPAEGEAVEE